MHIISVIESMLRPLVVTAALVGLACSANGVSSRPTRDPTKSSQLGMFMKTYMNPPFSKISFLLFHDEGEDSEISAAQLPSSADDLARAAERLSRWPDVPGESAQGKQVFSEYAEALRADTRSLVDALRGNQPEGAARVFESLRKKCDACHHFFRFDESTSLRPGSVANARSKMP